MNGIIASSETKRVLSPKRKENLENHLIVLGNGHTIQTVVEEKPSRPSSGRGIPDRPSSGGLFVLKTDADLKNVSPSRTFESGSRPNSSRTERRLPSVKRKSEAACECERVSSPCPTCSVIQTEVTKLRLNDTVANSAINSGVKVYSSTSKDKEASVLNDTKMQEKPISSSTNQISSSEDSSSSSTFDQLLKAPIELISRFLTAVMKKDFEEARDLCGQILKLEPTNSTCLEFKDVIAQKISQEEESESDSNEDDEDESEESDDESGESDSGNGSNAEDQEDSDDDEDQDEETVDVEGLNLLMGGVPIRKTTKRLYDNHEGSPLRQK